MGRRRRPGGRRPRGALLAAILAGSAREAGAVALQPNPPKWPETVRVFSPKDDPEEIQSRVDAAYAVNGGPGNQGQFSDERFAFLFEPGTYNVDVPVGYYTQVAGLGTLPGDVVFASDKGVHCREGGRGDGTGALNTFWRIAENFRSLANHSWQPGSHGMLWATSQASPLRRVKVENDLILYEDGYSSGGYLGNCEVNGRVMYGTQQQYFTRNAKIGSSTGGVWNMVFAGTEGAPESACGGIESHSVPFVTVDEVPRIAEKPFISIGQDKDFYLNVPSVDVGRRGTDFLSRDRINFNYVFVADASKDDDTSINRALTQGLHVVLSPGIYYLKKSIKLVADRQILLGLGLATLVPTGGEPAIEVSDVDGARVAGVLLQAGPVLSDVLLDWGREARPGKADLPGSMHDVFVRVGGPAKPEAQLARAMVRVTSGNVLGDNLWLWRADHTHAGEVRDLENPCDVGLIVKGGLRGRREDQRAGISRNNQHAGGACRGDAASTPARGRSRRSPATGTESARASSELASEKPPIVPGRTIRAVSEANAAVVTARACRSVGALAEHRGREASPAGGVSSDEGGGDTGLGTN